MRVKIIEARIAKLEASRGRTALSRMSDEDLDREVLSALNGLAAEHGSIGAAVTHLEATGDPLDRELAGAITACLADWPKAAARPAVQ